MLQINTLKHHWGANVIAEAIVFFNEMGWVANALAVAAPATATCGFIYKNRKNLFKGSSFLRFAESSVSLTKWNLEDSKKLSKVAIVDDEPEDFPINDLRGAGFSIKSYRQVKLADVAELAKFDVVFLDMYGIVKDDPASGGLRLISELRALNPGQKICAVSSKTFDPTASAFFKQADEVQKKPIAAQKCQELLRTLLGEKLNPLVLGRDIDQQLASDVKTRRKALAVALTYKDSQGEFSALMQDLSKLKMPLREQFQIADFARMCRHASK